MAMTAASLLDRLQRILSDVPEDRWTRETLLSYLSAAQQQIVTLRPDANAEVRSIQLLPGALQTIPDDAHAFLGAIRNMGADGETPGRAIKNKLLAEKESADPAWDDAMEGSVVREAVYDDMTPRQFWVSPLVPAAPVVQIAARLSVLPAELANEADALEVSETYREPILYWAASMAYDENTDAGSLSTAERYRGFAMQLLGVKGQADQKVTRSTSGPVNT